VQVVLTSSQGGQPLLRTLLADAGAGSLRMAVDLILLEADCLLCVANPSLPVRLGGAYPGSFPTYLLPVRIPALGFGQDIRAVAVRSAPAGFDGIACFRFLNRFTYGNFGDPGQFGLEC
jgi:hypothetical protein